DLVDGVVAADHGVVEGEVVGGDLGGDPDPTASRCPDQVDRPAGGDVRDVQACPDPGGQDQVPGDHDLLGLVGPSRQPQHGRHRALVHLGVGGQVGVLGVVADHGVEPGRVLQGTAHDEGVSDRTAVVREHVDACLRVVQFTELGQLRAGQVAGDRPDGV